MIRFLRGADIVLGDLAETHTLGWRLRFFTAGPDPCVKAEDEFMILKC